VEPARPETLTLHEAAERLGVHYMTAYRYVRHGQLFATKVG
jgi:excisionase family DNA binding protein